MELKQRYFIIHKPYGMESQFKPNYQAALLGDLAFDFPEGTHAIGRLDKYSEGLLLLTTDKRITKLLFESKVPHKRTYAVQVAGIVQQDALDQLRGGVMIRISTEGMYQTPPCDAFILDKAPSFPLPRVLSPYVKTTWLSITLSEGKFRQVRKMTAAIRHKCIRLIRTSIEDLELGDLQPGCVRELDQQTFFRLLKL